MRRTSLAKNILFLCEDNACLSLMAEAMAKHMGPPQMKIFSAGVKPGKIPGEVIRVLQEIGVQLAGGAPKGLSEVPLNDIDLVVSFGEAHAQCALLPPQAKIRKWSIANPAQVVDGNSGVLSVYRHGRDEIDKRLAALFLDHWRHVT